MAGIERADDQLAPAVNLHVLVEIAAPGGADMRRALWLLAALGGVLASASAATPVPR
jgi:hypothetical protein